MALVLSQVYLYDENMYILNNEKVLNGATSMIGYYFHKLYILIPFRSLLDSVHSIFRWAR